MTVVTMLRGVLEALENRHRYKRLVECDGSQLIQAYGARAVMRALEFEAQGAALLRDGRRKGHWRRVARCIAARPLPIRTDPIYS
jgi:hypothetical protein